jgi:hypothetical protein
MTGLDTQQTNTAVLLRCAEIDSNLQETKERLDQAATQLAELARVMLAREPYGARTEARSWFQELWLSELLADVEDAERRLVDARRIADRLSDPSET